MKNLLLFILLLCGAGAMAQSYTPVNGSFYWTRGKFNVLYAPTDRNYPNLGAVSNEGRFLYEDKSLWIRTDTGYRKLAFADVVPPPPSFQTVTTTGDTTNLAVHFKPGALNFTTGGMGMHVGFFDGDGGVTSWGAGTILAGEVGVPSKKASLLLQASGNAVVAAGSSMRLEMDESNGNIGLTSTGGSLGHTIISNDALMQIQSAQLATFTGQRQVYMSSDSSTEIINTIGTPVTFHDGAFPSYNLIRARGARAQDPEDFVTFAQLDSLASITPTTTNITDSLNTLTLERVVTTSPTANTSTRDLIRNNGSVSNVFSASVSAGVIGTTTNHSLGLYTNNLESMRMHRSGASGAVLVPNRAGTFAADDGLNAFQINGGVRMNSGIFSILGGVAPPSSGAGLFMWMSGSNAIIRNRDHAAGADRDIYVVGNKIRLEAATDQVEVASGLLNVLGNFSSQNASVNAFSAGIDPITKTADFTILSTDFFVTYVVNNGGGGTINITLPSANTVPGRIYMFKITTGATGGIVNVDGNAVALGVGTGGPLAIAQSNGANYILLQGF